MQNWTPPWTVRLSTRRKHGRTRNSKRKLSLTGSCSFSSFHFLAELWYVLRIDMHRRDNAAICTKYVFFALLSVEYDLSAGNGRGCESTNTGTSYGHTNSKTEHKCTLCVFGTVPLDEQRMRTLIFSSSVYWAIPHSCVHPCCLVTTNQLRVLCVFAATFSKMNQHEL